MFERVWRALLARRPVGRVFLCVLFMLLAVLSFAQAEPTVERVTPLTISFPYIKSDPVYEERSIYIQALLKLILDSTGIPFILSPADERTVPSSRTAMFMNQGHFNVAALHTNPDRERLMRPIRIPIFRGLGGWRLLFVRQADVDLFEGVASLAQLKQLMAGQGHDWPDTPILTDSGFKLRTSVNRDSLYEMLRLERIDFFPRGAYEIWHEEGLSQTVDLVIDRHLALRYPTATYLYVAKQDEALATLLEEGFETIIADGSFNRLFMSYLGEAIFKAQLDQRTIFEIPNPSLTAETPLQRKALWFHVEELK